MNRYNFKTALKVFATVLLVSTLLVPQYAQAQKKKDTSRDVIEDMLQYRYLNPSCEFSLQLPKAPSVRTIWWEDSSPISMTPNHGVGEFGEKISYMHQSIDGSEFFGIEAYCLYPTVEAIEALTENDIERQLQRERQSLKLRNSQISTQNLSNGLLAGALSGTQVNVENQTVTSRSSELYIAERSIMFIRYTYSSEGLTGQALFEAIRSSLYYDQDREMR